MTTTDSIRSLMNIVSEETLSYFRASASESDRAHALVSVAHLDNMMKIIMANVFIEDAKIKKQVFSRQLHSFSAKIDLAHGLGFIDKCIKEELDTLRNIRNHFAHSFLECTFDNPSTVENLSRLKFSMRVDLTSNREGNGVSVQILTECREMGSVCKS
jgi:DNA-binding MltR family transcriptional regulator